MADLINPYAKTFGALLLDMAVELGLARLTSTDGTDIPSPALPSDGSVLYKLKMRLNAGYLSFVQGADPARAPGDKTKPYTNWYFLTRPVSILLDPTGLGPLNIAADAGRYRLPDGITSGPKQGWTLANQGFYIGTRVQSATVERVRDELARNGTTTGCPVFAATRPISAPDSTDGGKAWEVMLAPRPSAAVTMSSDFRIQARELRELAQQHIAGSEHDRTILLFGLVEWYRRDDLKGDQFARAVTMASQALAASIDLDKRSRPMVVGPLQDPGASGLVFDRGMVASGQGTTVTYTQGIPLPG